MATAAVGVGARAIAVEPALWFEGLRLWVSRLIKVRHAYQLLYLSSCWYLIAQYVEVAGGGFGDYRRR